MKRAGGFTVLEVLICTSMFLVLVLVAFRIFEFGAWAAATSNLRHNLQSAASRVMLSLQTDLRRSAYSSVSILQRNPAIDGQSYQRDGMCFGGMSDWNDPAAFEPKIGAPSFDRYLAYYATESAAAGRLIRSVYGVSPRSPMPRQFAAFAAATHMRDDPKLNDPAQISYSELSSEVRDFRVADAGRNQAIRISLTLFRAGQRGAPGGEGKRDQSYQFEIQVTPLNTWPRE